MPPGPGSSDDHVGGPEEQPRPPYESLYREHEPPETTDPNWAQVAGPAPRDPADQPADDPYGWLFRSPDAAPLTAAEDESPTAVRPPAEPSTGTPGVPPPTGPSEPTPASPASPAPVLAAAGLGAGSGRPPVDDERPSRGRTGAVLLVLLAVVLVGALVLAALWFGGRTPDATRTPGGTGSASAASPTSTSAAPTKESTGRYDGTVTAVEPTAVAADCTAAAATDDAGNPVRYDADLTADGDVATAWRCDGNGRDHQLTFTLPAGTEVAEVGLINGYAKTDPASNKDRYPEYRRILAVTWDLGDGRTFSQQLEDGDEELQTLRIPVTDTDTVTLTIDDTSSPGESARTRNAVLISEVTLGSPS